MMENEIPKIPEINLHAEMDIKDKILTYYTVNNGKPVFSLMIDLDFITMDKLGLETEDIQQIIRTIQVVFMNAQNRKLEKRMKNTVSTEEQKKLRLHDIGVPAKIHLKMSRLKFING